MSSRLYIYLISGCSDGKRGVSNENVRKWVPACAPELADMSSRLYIYLISGCSDENRGGYNENVVVEFNIPNHTRMGRNESNEFQGLKSSPFQASSTQ
ncbi:hypothetical protein AVEN_193563-1 [Araneus ventricosus]|uniref:Uncharacterized protein n=1 Tax=Araneus ventricosus TaxID=182803 RepID=A0A4Y2RI54_ARAVE|nr:hypothetical protein AVEN_193563-1 [Araneus ventricosus]